MDKVKYQNQPRLRSAAHHALEQRGYAVESVKGSGGARVKLRGKDQSSLDALIRTSSDRWAGFMRKDGDFRGLKDADLVVIAVLDREKNPINADIYGFAPKDVLKAFRENLAARKKATPDLSETAPIFVCLDEIDRKDWAPAVGSNLKEKALWHAQLPLDPASKGSARAKELPESFVIRVKQEFADLMGVSVEKVSVNFSVSL